jgi:hypothetical protein
MSANLRSSKTMKHFLRAISLRAFAVRSVQSVTMSQCVFSMQMWSPHSSARASSSAEVSTSADKQRLVCFMDIRRKRYEASGPVASCPARAR